jgi:signal transduction histidine kinase
MGGLEPLFLGYVGAFALGAVGCFAGLVRVDRITDTDVRYGLTALLLTSGWWAAAHVGYLAAPTPTLQHVFYAVGLVVGIAAVGPWLYFCSAYTGRSLHKNQMVRRVAVLIFLAIISVKLTNPIHGWYYSTTVVSEPFPHLLVRHGTLHWVVMGLAYALALVGFFMLFELFVSVDHEVRPLMILVGVTGLPVATDVAGVVSESILELTYSPLGVAAFALGVMFVYLDLFQQLQVADDSTDCAIFLDENDRIRDSSPTARDLFPSLEEAQGDPLPAVLPHVAELFDTSESTVELKRNGTTRYYHVGVDSVVRPGSTLGKIVLLTDITDREQYRQELERQNERLERFTSTISHDLRNPLNVAMGHLEIVGQDHDDEHIDAMGTALTRMETLIGDLLELARQGQAIEDTVDASLSTCASEAWDVVETNGCDLAVENEYRFKADSERVRQLFENLFRNAIEHGETVGTIQVGEIDDGTGFYVEDDGVGIPEEIRDDVLDVGYTTNADGTGLGLGIVAEIVDAHRWGIDVTESGAGGARFEIRTSGPRHTRTGASPSPSGA